ncbi:ATP-grasp domain-containing protein [Lysinibacillus sp. SGAir0095]|uniref:ATP-grasp domain-containing protein n=1 Tax=Lysinibacillus sp. SGAir0095 TaxID=2070463 RepID=UPI0010CD176B|nr:ATP-grasp domain-containing protein [Lysinibacillus sp. SGAir0095]QCR31978.1 carbamoyl-phosphate-synthetase [Lysinibacillus sp. SGAir0095]
MKKVLILGGSSVQIPIIKKARQMGHYVVVCDYLEENPGRHYAHEFHNISTTDKEKLYDIAAKLNIDAIVCYSSDTNAVPAAYVSEKLRLPTHPYKSIEILTNKEKFRGFLKENNFNTPRAKAFCCWKKAEGEIHRFKMPVMIKPVDSSGSKGVSKIDSIDSLKEKVENALNFSRENRFLIEEFIESKNYYHVGGEGFSVNGKLVFREYYNEHFPLESPNPFVSMGASYPIMLSDQIQKKIDAEIQRVLHLLDMKTGAYNFEIRIDDSDQVYLIEMAPRNGVGYQSLLKYTTNFDIDENVINAALGHQIHHSPKYSKEYWGIYGFYSNENGIFKGIDIEEEFSKGNIVEFELFVEPGEQISKLRGAHDILGCMIFKFSCKKELFEKIENMSEYVKVSLEDR